MKLQNGSLAPGSDLTLKCVVDSLCLLCAVCYKNDLACAHDIADTHGQSCSRNLVGAVEQSGVCLDGAFGQINTVGLLFKCSTRLVEPDMTVVAKAQKLKVDPTLLPDDLSVMC